MKASKNVSEDYDQIAAFFDIMSSMLERLSLLESKLPSAKNYRTILMRVFSSLMGLCGTATKYVTEGRFKHWLKALYKGADGDIKGDYTTLETNIQRLESATMFATLATVMETKTDVKDLTIISMQSLQIGTRSLEVGIETQSMVQNVSIAQGESLDILKKMQRILRKEELKKQNEMVRGANLTLDPGAKKTAALSLIKTAFAVPGEPAVMLQEVQKTFVEGTFSWIREETSYQMFLEGDSPFLWIHGPPGIGKSHAAYSIIGNLLEFTKDDPRTSVAYYLFKEDNDFYREAKNMLRTVVIQTAMNDVKYRDEVAAEVKRMDMFHYENLENYELWRPFFAERYPKDADQRLFLVLDGLDEMSSEDCEGLLGLFTSIRVEELAIQIVFTSRKTTAILSALEPLRPSEIEIRTSKICESGGDLWKVIIENCKRFPKLERLRKRMVKTIATELLMKADTFLYIDHVLPRLDQLGRETLIVKELSRIPIGLMNMYDSLLHDCQSYRSAEQFTALKTLFAFASYSMKPLTLGEALAMLALIPGGTSVSLEEEIDTRCSRILEVGIYDGEPKWDELEFDSSDDSASSSSESDEEMLYEEPLKYDSWIMSPLKFQDRVMREYFRSAEAEGMDLRSTPSSAHLKIFETAVRSLLVTQEEFDDAAAGVHIWNFQHYSVNFWLQHFLAIDVEKASDSDVKVVIESLHSLMDCKRKALRALEVRMSVMPDTNIFGEHGFNLQKEFFARFALWIRKAAGSLPKEYSDEIIEWMQLCSDEDDFLMWLVKQHIQNWFVAKDYGAIQQGANFAISSFRLTAKAEEVFDEGTRSGEEITIIANLFPELQKTANALLMIGRAYLNVGDYENALENLEESLITAESDIERYDALYQIANSYFILLSPYADEESAEDNLRKCYEAIDNCLALYHGKEEVKKYSESIDDEWQYQWLVTTRARCEVKMGNVEAAVVTMLKVEAANEFAIWTEILDEIIEHFEKKGEWKRIIELVRKVHVTELRGWLDYNGLDPNRRIQRAAWECNDKDFLIGTYDKILSAPYYKLYGERRFIQSSLAQVHRSVFPDFEESKRLWREMFAEYFRKYKHNWDTVTLYDCRLQLADVLTLQFRSTNQGTEKIALYGEMKELALEHQLAMIEDFNPYQSQTSISLAVMMRVMASSQDFQTHMEKTFQSCIEALTDETTENDSMGFRQLAKTLALVPGLTRETRIAYTLQFLEVSDYDAPWRDENDGDATNDSGGEKENPGSRSAVGSIGFSNVDNRSIGLPIRCGGCSTDYYSWNAGSLYFCIMCTDCHLCESCWKQRTSCKDADWKSWRLFCGEDHKYIRGPIENWLGFEKGVMKFVDWDNGSVRDGGEVESKKSRKIVQITFEDWLKEVQSKWVNAWKEFWTTDSFVVDAF
ncbi:hypothetical protein ONS95_008436 [Cadophora gregata]|nr:uncharacterized protein ONS95_008436 [Cadophora gregata]KAK0100488.1 hypothetical protein ONS96_007763 [Cadophora gregata f. sp. sojae]KAK0126858.1 hypothetical protein ONS95_008436 [Cadophora gregata]